MCPATKASTKTDRRNGGRGGGRGADNATRDEQCHPRKIFVGGLAHETTTQHVHDYFASYGAVVDAIVLRWPDGRSRGFGYATFADASGASEALNAAHIIGGRSVDVKRAVPGTNKLFVGGLSQSTTAAELRELFENFGVVSDAVVMIDPATGRSRGFGFICFLPGQDGAQAVASTLAKYDSHCIRGKWIEVKSAAPPHKLAGKDGASSPSTATSSDTRENVDALSLADFTTNRSNECKVVATSSLGSPMKVEFAALATPTEIRQASPVQTPPKLVSGADGLPPGHPYYTSAAAAYTGSPPMPSFSAYSLPWGLPPTHMGNAFSMPPGFGAAGVDAAALAAIGNNPMSYGLGWHPSVQHYFMQLQAAQMLEKMKGAGAANPDATSMT